MSFSLNLLATARSMDNPQRLLLQQLVPAEPQRLPAMKISALQVSDFVSRIVHANAELERDLESLRKSPPVNDSVVNAVRWIYFATQHCHIFGWTRSGEFSMEDNLPMCCFAAYNKPCGYAWFDQCPDTWELSLVKHSLVHTELDLRIAVESPEGTARFVYTIDRCMRIPTSRAPVFTLCTRDTGPSCPLGGPVPDCQFVEPFTLVLSFGKRFKQAVLVRVQGQRELQPAFLHSLL